MLGEDIQDKIAAGRWVLQCQTWLEISIVLTSACESTNSTTVDTSIPSAKTLTPNVTHLVRAVYVGT